MDRFRNYCKIAFAPNEIKRSVDATECDILMKRRMSQERRALEYVFILGSIYLSCINGVCTVKRDVYIYICSYITYYYFYITLFFLLQLT